MTDIRHIFFDIGGVLGTNGWDREQRKGAIEKFGLDETEFTQRHQEVIGQLEIGELGVDEYLDFAVFYEKRSFSKDEFRNFIFDQSQPFPETIAIARAVAEGCRYWVMTLNNEGEDLNRYRIRKFGLGEIFDAFLSSCWLGLRKPTRKFYERGFAIAEADPARSVFIDDRLQNLHPAEEFGVQTIHYQSPEQLAVDLRALGVEFKLNEKEA